jgi:NAD-dependent deacetylase
VEQIAHLEQLAEWMASSQRTTVLTGAGISTRSGIPDFRSPDSGMWVHADPMQVASIWGFREDPAAFYRWIRPLAHKMWHARPNSAHLALAHLEAQNLLHTIVTQNIDHLHQKAGSRRVLHVHGTAESAVCLGCGSTFREIDFWQPFLADSRDQLPTCLNCGAVLKPDVVLFGEELPHETLREAQQAALDCDLMIVVGSSLEVMPTADLPFLARRRGAKLAIINLGKTEADHRADLVIRADVTQALPRLVEQAKIKISRKE